MSIVAFPHFCPNQFHLNSFQLGSVKNQSHSPEASCPCAVPYNADVLGLTANIFYSDGNLFSSSHQYYLSPFSQLFSKSMHRCDVCLGYIVFAG